ncbi:MAG: hypothetical protein QXU18_07370 [Thermoplasmatales archaeon]
MVNYFYSIMYYTNSIGRNICVAVFSNLMTNLRLKDRRIYRLNRSHAISLPAVWLEIGLPGTCQESRFVKSRPDTVARFSHEIGGLGAFNKNAGVLDDTP